MKLILPLILLLGCTPLPPPAETQQPLTQAQSDWVRDVCIPESLRGGVSPWYTVGHCTDLVLQMAESNMTP